MFPDVVYAGQRIACKKFAGIRGCCEAPAQCGSISTQRAFLAVRRGIENMVRHALLAAREPEPRCRYVRNRWNHASMIKIGKAFVQRLKNIEKWHFTRRY